MELHRNDSISLGWVLFREFFAKRMPVNPDVANGVAPVSPSAQNTSSLEGMRVSFHNELSAQT